MIIDQLINKVMCNFTNFSITTILSDMTLTVRKFITKSQILSGLMGINQGVTVLHVAVMFCTFSSINPYLNAKIALIPRFPYFFLFIATRVV